MPDRVRAVFLLNYRAGSSFFQICCGRGTKDYAKNIKANRFFNPLLPTTSKCPCGDNNRPPWNYRPTDPQYAWVMHLGDFWKRKQVGRLALNVPIGNPYSTPDCPGRWGAQELKRYGPEYRFACILRDGRNQIESLRSLKGGVEDEYNQKDPVAYFEYACKAWAVRTRVSLDASAADERYRVFYFRDLISDPDNKISDIYSHVGLELEREKYLEYKSSWTRNNSRFDDKVTGQHERWKNWTDQEKDTFKRIANDQLIKIGCVEDDSW